MKNNILQLKGEFTQKSSDGQPGASNLPKNGIVNVVHIEQLQKTIARIKKLLDERIIFIRCFNISTLH